MLKLVFLFLSILTGLSAIAQKTDSIKHKNGYIYFHEFGKGKPIIMLSGGPGFSAEKEQEVAINLSKKYRCIVLEQRGTGRSIPYPSDSTTINIKSYHNDLTKLLHHLKLKEAIFYGHSWGGLLAMSFACVSPEKVKALILVGTSSFNPNDNFWYTLRLNRLARYGHAEWQMLDSLLTKERLGKMSFMDSLEKRKLMNFTNIYNINKVDEISFKLSAATLNEKTMDLMLYDLKKTKLNLTSKLSLYKKPIFAICGNQDPIAFVTYELKNLMPKTQISWINACGHYPMYEQEEIFYPKLFEILGKVK